MIPTPALHGSGTLTRNRLQNAVTVMEGAHMSIIQECSAARRGGIPLSFPQYGRGEMQTDGFLRDLHW